MANRRVKLITSLTVVSMVLGFMIALQYRQTAFSRYSVTESSMTDIEQNRLAQQLKALKDSNGSAQAQLAKIATQLDNYEKTSAGANAQLVVLQKRLEDERILAGLTPVHGPGVSVTLMDGSVQGTNIESYLTHDWDVRSVINELFTAGAEAISINGYRVVATSGVFCRGPVVSVNNHRIGAPFTISAIGEPHTLLSALDIQGGVLDLLRQRNLQVSNPIAVQTISMPAFTGNVPASGTLGQ